MSYRIAPQQSSPKPTKKVAKKPGYLNFLHLLPCCVTGREGVEAAHLSFANTWYGHYGRAKGTKAPDLFALPLSPDEHRAQHRMSEQGYWDSVGINPHELAVTLFAIYSAYGDDAEGMCRARIMQGLDNGGLSSNH